MPNEPKSTVELKLNGIERTLEVHSTRMDAIDKRLVKVSEVIEANSQQIATFTESLTRLENAITRLEGIVEKGFGNLESLIKQQHETTKMQSNHIDRLMGVVEVLLTKVA